MHGGSEKQEVLVRRQMKSLGKTALNMLKSIDLPANTATPVQMLRLGALVSG
jgi:hypothetical protein